VHEHELLNSCGKIDSPPSGLDPGSCHPPSPTGATSEMSFLLMTRKQRLEHLDVPRHERELGERGETMRERMVAREVMYF
jgi:hypothetical protein